MNVFSEEVLQPAMSNYEYGSYNSQDIKYSNYGYGSYDSYSNPSYDNEYAHFLGSPEYLC